MTKTWGRLGQESEPLWGTETRESIWIGFVDLAAAQTDLHALTTC